jgi:hypothetical protein
MPIYYFGAWHKRRYNNSIRLEPELLGIIADNLSKAGWSWGCVSAVGFQRANNVHC